MSKAFNKFYWVRGTIFENSENKVNAKGKAIRYCRENGIDESEIYGLSNKSELAYLETLMNREDVSEIKSHNNALTIFKFTNANNDEIPQLDIQCSFIYKKGEQLHLVSIVDSVYELTKLFIIQKIIIDYYGKENGIYLQVLYLDQVGNWKEWKIGDKSLAIEERKANHKKMLTQKKAIRDRQKYDRLLKLREQGKISEKQSQELYRLQKVFGG